MTQENICVNLNESANKIHHNNKQKGFWDRDVNVGEMLMLVVSEIGEAMEAHRNGRFARIHSGKVVINTICENLENAIKEEDVNKFKDIFKIQVKDTFEDEIADAIIRLLDLSAGLGIDIEKHINFKVAFNKTREKLHGKLY